MISLVGSSGIDVLMRGLAARTAWRSGRARDEPAARHQGSPCGAVRRELRIHEDAAQVRVPGEMDAEQVPRLALGPFADCHTVTALATTGSSSGTGTLTRSRWFR
jgi:hypothetical protein